MFSNKEVQKPPLKSNLLSYWFRIMANNIRTSSYVWPFKSVTQLPTKKSPFL